MALSWIAPANNHGGFVFCIHRSRYTCDLLLAQKQFVLSIATAAQKQVLLDVGKCTGRVADKFLVVSGLKKTEVGGAVRVEENSAVQRSKESQNSFSVFGNGSDSDSSESDSKDGEPQPGGLNKKCDKGPVTDRKKRTILNLEKASCKVASDIPAVLGTVAHLRCSVIRNAEAADAGHVLVTAQIDEVLTELKHFSIISYLQITNFLKAWVDKNYWDGKVFIANAQLSTIPLLSFLGSQQFASISRLE